MAQSSATELFEQYYKTLIYVLPMKDATFMDELLGNGLLTGDVKIKLDSLTVLNQRASYFLDSVIKPELAIGRSRSFVNLLTIMKSNKYDNVKELAKEIENELAIDIKYSSTPVLKDLHNILIPKIANNWYEVGIQLFKNSQLPKLDEIQATYSTDRRGGCIKMLNYWLQITPEATWEDLICALRKPGLELFSLADYVEKIVRGKCGKVIDTLHLDTPKRLQSQNTLDHPDAYTEKFEDDDVFSAFGYLFYRLGILFGEVDFTVLKSACIQRGTLRSSDFKQQIKAANELDDLLDALDNPMYCNWLNISLLKRIVKTIDIPEAKNLIQAYENCVYSRKVSDVITHCDLRCFNQSHISSVVAKINTRLDDLTVADVIKHCQKLEENILGVDTGSVTAAKLQSGCLQITCIIPMHCVLHAYKTAKTNFLNFRQFHIQYIEIESFPKVFALKFRIDENHLDKSSVPDTNQVISHYYTSLENHMDADSVSHMMHCEHLITDDDYEAITAAPNDNKMNTLLLQYVKSMNVTQLSRFCEILRSIETHKIFGDCSSTFFQGVLQKLSTNVRVGVSKQSMASSIKNMKMSEVHMIFYDLVDHLHLHLCAIKKFSFDVIRECVVNSPFTEQWLRKIGSCKSLYLYKIYLLPYTTWLDHSILKDLVEASGSEDAQKLLNLFDSAIYSYRDQPITLFPIPCPSQLMIPLDSSDYTILSMKFCPPSRGDNTQGMLILQDIMKIKQTLKHKWNIRSHDIQLVAVHTKFELLYWMIPKCLVKVIENDLIHDRTSGIIMMAVLPPNFQSDEDGDNEKLSGPFSSLSFLWQDDTEILSLQNKLENIDTQNFARQYLQLQDKIRIIKEENEKNKVKLNELKSLIDIEAKLKIDTNLESESKLKVIRELREEVEKLRQLLKDQGGGPLGTASNPSDSQDVEMLKEKLSISENLMQEMSKTWEQKLAELKLHEERQKALEDMGISVKSAGIGVQRDKFYLVNLNADPIMSELLVCYLKPHTKIGRPDAEVQQDIQLKGLGIQPEHCVVEVVDPEVFITPLPAARTLVNGKVVTEKTKLSHGYQVLLGNNHFFRVSCPNRKGTLGSNRKLLDEDTSSKVKSEQNITMLIPTSSLNSAHITNEEIGSKAENPERKLKFTSFKNKENEDRHQVLLEFGNLCFQLIDSDDYKEAKQLFLLSNTVIPCFWRPKVPSHLPAILCTEVLTKLVELMKEHGNTWSVAHMCVSLPLPEETMMILLASDPLKEHFTSTCHPKMYRLLHLAIEQKSVNACRAIMRCSKYWLKEDPGLYVEDTDHMLPIQKAREIGAQECIDYLMHGQSGHDTYSQKTGGIFGYFSRDVPQLFCTYLETKNSTKIKELLEGYPGLVRADFINGNTGLHKAKDAKTIVILLEHGADISTRNQQGDTALHAIIRADYDKENQMVATERQECVLALITYGGCDPNCWTKGEMTPSHLAAYAMDLLSLKALIAFGADLSLPNDDGKSVMDIAKLNEWSEGINLLYMLGAVSYSVTDSIHGQRNILSLQPMYCKQLSDDEGSELTEGDKFMDSLSTSLQLETDDPQSKFTMESSKFSLSRKPCNGDRVLCLDGGWMKGLILIEMLSAIERATGKRIVDLFDWFVGTNTGGILALALVYTNKSLDEMRTMYFKFKDSVFSAERGIVPQGETEVLEKILKETFGETQTLGSRVYPRVLITTTDISQDPPRLEFFSNFDGGDLGKDQLIWVAARCTSAAPIYFKPYKQYIDGGIKANNPSLDALTRIHEYYKRSHKRQNYKITILVSLGCGWFDQKRKNMAAMDFIHYWKNFSWWRPFLGIQNIASSISGLLDIYLTEVMESNHRPVQNTRSHCERENIKYYRLSPHMDMTIELDEQSCEKLVDMLIKAKLYILQSAPKVLEDIKKYTDV